MAAGRRPRDMRARAAVLVVVGLVALSGCGEDGEAPPIAAPPSSGESWTGPLYVPARDATHPEAGAAGEVVECTTWGSGGFSREEVYAEGATADSPDEALEVAASERLFPGPTKGLRPAAEDGDRMLYVLEVADEVKQAIVLRDGPATEGAGGDGWYVESWAQCDPVELPRWYTDSIGLQVWTDEQGRPVPATRLEAWRGPEHCDWQSMTFLQLRGRMYVGNLAPDLEELAVGPFRAHTELPADAVDTGFRRDGDRLWLSADRKRAYVGSPDDVEEWPSAQLGCE